MKWFESKTRNEIKELRYELASLRAELCRKTEIRIGELPIYSGEFRDQRPTVELKEVVMILAKHLNLEIKRTPEVSAKAVLVSNKKTENQEENQNV